MIEVVSWPPVLIQWVPTRDPYYLELYGETSPLLDTTLAEVIPAGTADPVTASPAPVYEYWWTLGHSGAAPHPAQPADIMDAPRPGPQTPVWENLRGDVAARVYVYFPISGGWRVREIVATVKYLMPVHQQQAWWSQVAQDLKMLSPLAADAGSVAGLIPGGATASKWLQTVSKLQVGSVPQSKEFPWSVEKVTSGGNGHDVLQGVLWDLPASLLEAQGGRLTGSLAVSVMPTPSQSQGQAGSTLAVRPMAAKAHAGIYPKDGAPIWVPGPDAQSFIELMIAPALPPTAGLPG
jgi:hypothetical protein